MRSMIASSRVVVALVYGSYCMLLCLLPLEIGGFEIFHPSPSAARSSFSTNQQHHYGIAPTLSPYMRYGHTRCYDVIYGGIERDDDDDDESPRISSESTTTAPTSSSTASDLAISYLQQHSEPSDWIRWACAFCGPSHRLHPSRIPNARIVQVDATHLDVAVDLVEDQVAIQILVTVPFVTPLAGAADWQATLGDNIHELNQQSLLKIAEQEKLEQQQQQQQQQVSPFSGGGTVWNYLQQPPDSWPGWWVVPTGEDIVDECRLLKQLVNGDEFAPERTWLWRQYTTTLHRNAGQVCMAAVGPAGLIIRAQCSAPSGPEEDVVTIKFPAFATSATELRSLVLDLVELASPQATTSQELPSPVVAESESIGTPAVETTDSTDQEGELPKMSPDYLEARRQPKSVEQEAALARKYAAILDLGERAYTILLDLGMI